MVVSIRAPAKGATVDVLALGAVYAKRELSANLIRSVALRKNRAIKISKNAVAIIVGSDREPPDVSIVRSGFATQIIRGPLGSKVGFVPKCSTRRSQCAPKL